MKDSMDGKGSSKAGNKPSINRWAKALGRVSSSRASSESPGGSDKESSSSEEATIDRCLARTGSCSFFDDMSQGKYDQWDPELCVQLLRLPSVQNYSGMKRWLDNSSKERLSTFLELDGLTVLFESLEKLCDRGFASFADAVTQLECVSCIKIVMNSKIGLNYIIEHDECTRKLVRALETRNTLVKKQVFELLSAVTISSDKGHEATLCALEAYRISKHQRYRFGVIVNELKETDVVPYRAALLAFINCLVAFPDDLKVRLRLRHEFCGLGLLEIVAALQQVDDENLAIQCSAFDRDKLADEEEAADEGFDVNVNVHALFETVLASVHNTPSEFSLIHMLRSVADASENANLSDNLWAALEATAAAVVANRSVPKKPRKMAANNNDNGKKLDMSTQTERNENADSYLTEHNQRARRKPERLSTSSDTSGVKSAMDVHGPELLTMDKTLGGGGGGSSDATPVEPSQETVNSQPMPLRAPPPPLPLNSSCDTRRGRCPPPPPPPPPPLPRSLSCKPRIPPPPPPPVSCVPLRTAGVPPPPLPTSTMISHFEEMIREPSQKMKTLSWSKLTPQAVEFTDNSVWGSLKRKPKDSRKLNLEEIEQLFSRSDVTSAVSRPTRKMKMEVSFLSAKKSLGVNIFLAQFKDFAEVITKIRLCDSNYFGLDKLLRLEKILPEKAELEAITAYSGDMNNLGSAERFCLQLSEVEAYGIRIRGMLLVEELSVNIAALVDQMDVLTKAAVALLKDDHLAEFLALVLDTGNFLNAGSYAGTAAGFRLKTLSRLRDTKSNKRGVTLLHYLVETAEKQDKDMLSFAFNMSDIKRASRYSLEEIGDEIKKLEGSLRKFEKELAVSPEDVRELFSTFLKDSDRSMKNLINSYKQADDEARRLAAYFCEDKSDFKLKDCLVQFVAFGDRIIEAKKENEQRSLLEAKAKQAKEEKGKFKSRKSSSKTMVDGANEKECLIDKLLGEIKRGSFKLRKMRLSTAK